MISWCCKYSNGNTVAPLSPAGRQQHFLFKKNSRSPMQEHQIPFKNTKHTGCYAQLISIFTPSPCLTTTLCPYSDFLTGLGSLKISSNSSRPFLRLEHSSPHSQPLQEMEDREDGVSLPSNVLQCNRCRICVDKTRQTRHEALEGHALCTDLVVEHLGGVDCLEWV
jgi:hypothetical protein